MGEKIFISYVRHDEEQVEQIRGRLEVFGYDVWFDKRELLPGQEWDKVISDSIRASKAFLACVSGLWTDGERYVHREVELAFQVQSKQRSDLLIIPLQLDETCLPPRLKKIHAIDMSTNYAFHDLFKVLGHSFPEVRSRAGEKLGDRLRFIEMDSWPLQTRSTQLETLFDHFRMHAINRSEQFLLKKDWNAVLHLWAPVEDNEYFRINHTLWEGKDFYLVHVQQAKIDIAISHIKLSEGCHHLGGTDFQHHVQAAFSLISEIIEVVPFDESFPNGSDSKVTTNWAIAKNNDYKDFTSIVLSWLDWWGPVLAELGGVEEHYFVRLRTNVANRLSELVALREKAEKER